ncbi:MAG TPA: FkbM family methyltransferase [Rhizomicrobium sp.]|jgi:FkbM family methyltransferase|nr:FkbM family methyltransferase [Rhizomicrobium sp.]
MQSAKKMLFQTLRGLFARAGLNVTINRPVRNRMKLLTLKIKELGVGTVLDVGANRGQFAMELRGAGYAGPIVSFEPLAAVYPLLQQRARRDKNWSVAPRMALGDVPGRAQINIAQNLDSSSLLTVSQRSIDAASETHCVGTDDIEIRRLDEVIHESWKKPFALKLDTQGFELQVLKGAETVLKNTAVIMTELSLAPLYDGGATMVEVFQLLELQGFRCIGLMEGFVDVQRNEVLQVDGIFIRQS